jgi:hypothetical protein
MSSMTRFPGARGGLCVGLAVLVGVVSLTAQRRWSDTAPSRSGLSEEERRTVELDARARGFIRRMERKGRVVEALLADRLTLLEAAACFGFLNHQPPEFRWEYFRTLWPGDTDEERLCHEVIDLVHGVLLSSTDRARAGKVRDRLHAELWQHLGDRPLELPDVGAIAFEFDEE